MRGRNKIRSSTTWRRYISVHIVTKSFKRLYGSDIVLWIGYIIRCIIYFCVFRVHHPINASAITLYPDQTPFFPLFLFPPHIIIYTHIYITIVPLRRCVDSCSKIIILFIQFSKNVLFFYYGKLNVLADNTANWHKILPRISLLYFVRPRLAIRRYGFRSVSTCSSLEVSSARTLAAWMHFYPRAPPLVNATDNTPSSHHGSQTYIFAECCTRRVPPAQICNMHTDNDVQGVPAGIYTERYNIPCCRI